MDRCARPKVVQSGGKRAEILQPADVRAALTHRQTKKSGVASPFVPRRKTLSRTTQRTHYPPARAYDRK